LSGEWVKVAVLAESLIPYLLGRTAHIHVHLSRLVCNSTKQSAKDRRGRKCWRSEIRGQKTEDGGQITEEREEVEGQKSASLEVGGNSCRLLPPGSFLLNAAF
jgi:hypothetical protein